MMLFLSACAIPTSPKVDYIAPANETLENLALIYFGLSPFFRYNLRQRPI